MGPQDEGHTKGGAGGDTFGWPLLSVLFFFFGSNNHQPPAFPAANLLTSTCPTDELAVRRGLVLECRMSAWAEKGTGRVLVKMFGLQSPPPAGLRPRALAGTTEG